MDHEAVIEYMCPRCGAQITMDEKRCPGCDAILDWLEEHEVPGAGPQEGAPSETAAAMVAGPTPDGGEALADEAAHEGAAPPGPGAWEERAVRGDGRPTEVTGPETSSGPFGFLYSNVGAISFAVMLVAFVGTMLVLRWDTWVGGAEVETIGRLQLAAACAGIATIVATGCLGVWDALRIARAGEG